MADRFYGVNKGSGVDPAGGVAGQALATGTSTTGKNIELRVVEGAGITKQDLLNALELLKNYVIRPDTAIIP